MKSDQSRKLADFYTVLLEAERAGVQSVSDIIPSVEDGELESIMIRYIRDEGMNCQMLIALTKILVTSRVTKPAILRIKSKGLKLLSLRKRPLPTGRCMALTQKFISGSHALTG